MAIAQPPRIEDVCQLVTYDPATGDVRWAAHVTGYGRKPGRIVGGGNGGGYRRVNILNHRVMYHRLVWAMHYGSWPDGFIDHINGDRSDNRASNLRVVTAAENSRNRRPRAGRELPFGVYRNNKGFQASIRRDNKWIGLGTYPTPEEASIAYHQAKERFGFHRNHGT